VAIAVHDAGAFEGIRAEGPAPTITVYRQPEVASFIDRPLIEGEK